MAVWVVRAGKNGEQEQFAFENDVAVVDWPKLGDLKGIQTREELENYYRMKHPEQSPRTVGSRVGQLWLLINEISIGDVIVLPSLIGSSAKRKDSTVALGLVTEPYSHRVDFIPEAKHTIPVFWLKKDIDRSLFGEDNNKSLGRPPTVYQVKDNSFLDNVNNIVRSLEKTQLHYDLDSCIFPDEIAVDTREGLFEGEIKKVLVNVYERDPKARLECIEHYGARCSACEMDFEQMYGTVGKGFIHVHHLKPFSSIRVGYIVDPVNDLRPVCPNCHGIIHRKQNSVYTLEEVRAFIREARDLKI